MFALAGWKVIDNACPLIVHAPDTPSESPSLQPSTQLRRPRGGASTNPVSASKLAWSTWRIASRRACT
jgi:hypothetical protein